jgi:3-methyladenine DNA glycosylase AlkD
MDEIKIPKQRGGRRPGAGRKTVKREQEDFQVLRDIFTKTIDVRKLKRKIDSGKYNAKEMFQLKVLEGNIESMNVLFRKFFPDSIIQQNINKKEFEGIKLDI